MNSHSILKIIVASSAWLMFLSQSVSVGGSGLADREFPSSDAPLAQQRPKVQFRVSSQSITEQDTGINIIVSIIVQLDVISTLDVLVSYDVSGTAVDGIDYTENTGGSLVIPAGDLSADIRITVIGDDLYEADETVVLSLGTPTNADLGTRDRHTATIVDDDDAPSLSFSAADYTVNENQSAQITVLLSPPAGRTVTVNYATHDPTSGSKAVAGEDYIAANGTLTFFPGQTSKSFSVTILDDALDEDQEQVWLTLTSPNPGEVQIDGFARLFINDNAPPAILHVKPSASGDASCSDWDNACTLQTALGVATPGDEIWAQEGLYKPVAGIGYASCQEIRDAFPEAANGDYLINTGGDVFQVYCDNMDSTPVEYLTLRSQDANFAQYTAGGASPGTDVRTRYSRVRLLPDSLQIAIGDQRYSSSTGSLTHGTTEVTSMPYGVAMDCLNLGSHQGVAGIDLRGTPFAVSDAFGPCGWFPAGSWTFSEGNQVVQLSGGGYCGWVQPAATACLTTPYNDAGGAQPILELSYQGPELRATFQLKSGVAVYGGFAGNETSRDQRDWGTHPTVLSGDIDGNDLTDPHGVLTTTAHISGSNSYHVVTGSGVDVTAVLDGFTITGGDADGVDPHGDGGGMYNEGGNPTLRNITLRGNAAGRYGGGMYNAQSNPTLTETHFISNTAGWGGGMTNSESDPRLTDVTFSGNRARYAGGMENGESNPTLVNVTFSGNSASEGSAGGMSNLWSDPTLTGVTFISNTAATNGGGMQNQYLSKPVLTNVTFRGNIAGRYGGGMINEGTSPSLIDVIFSENAASSAGGGMFNVHGSPTLTGVIFSGNRAGEHGGGMYNIQGSGPALVNVAFSGNSARLNGGGIFNNASTSELVNATFVGNDATSGGGIFNEANTSAKLTNAILWGNTDGSTNERDAQIFNAASTITVSYSLVAGGVYTGTGNISADPLFVRDPDPGDSDWITLGDNDYGDLRLQLTSPAIDAGDNTAVPAGVITDLDGNPRFVDMPDRPDTGVGPAPIVDMGAYEAQMRFVYLPLTLRNH